MKPQKLLVSVVIMASLGDLLLPYPGHAQEAGMLASNPPVVIEVTDPQGKAAAGVEVGIWSYTDNAFVEMARTDKEGRLTFTSAPKSLGSADAPVVDAVYRAYVSGANREIATATFAVPHATDKTISVEDLRLLEERRVKTIQVQLTGNSAMAGKPKLTPNRDMPTTGCTLFPAGHYYRCVEDSRTYAKPTVIGTVHVGNGETAQFKFDWDSFYQFGGTVSMTTDVGTTVDYTVNGTCTYASGGFGCNLGRNVRGMYSYRYEKASFWDSRDRSYWYTEQTVTPISFNGGATPGGWFLDGRDGKPVSQVQEHQHGAPFQVFSGGSTTKKYSAESSFAMAASISTPIGTYHASATTQYANSLEITWSTTTSTVFWHYDYNTADAMFFVTH